MTPDRLFIGGAWRASQSVDVVRSPWDGHETRIPRASPQDVDDAIAAAAAAARGMAALPSHARRELLARIAAGITARRDDLARAIVSESGKPVTATKAEIDRAAITFTLGAEESTRIAGEVIPVDLEPRADGMQAYARRVAVGPIAAITPFNFPLNLAAHKIAPAFAAGCPVVLKPPPQAPGASQILAEIVEQAGAPAGAFSVVPCAAETAQRLVTDPRLKMLSFTGSARVGWTLKGLAGRKKITLELGGNAGVLIGADADLATAAKKCAAASFAQAGQICIKVQRIFVEAPALDAFTKLFLDETAKLKTGDPSDPATSVGPLIDEAAAARVESWVDEAIAHGARRLAGGPRTATPSGAKALLPPTVLSGARADDKVVCEEIFGPVTVVAPVASFSDGLARLNDGDYGLQAGVFTRALAHAQAAFATLDVGAVLVNEVPTFRIDAMPYGGVKGSGFGREGVRYAIEEMTERKLWLLRS